MCIRDRSEKSGTAQVRDIAEMLKVKMPSVTSAVKQLADMGLVEYTQYAPCLLYTSLSGTCP